jgi:hypothetical protein
MPAMPPLTAVIRPSSTPYRLGSETSWRSISRQIGTTGPVTPWMMRPANSMPTLTADAATMLSTSMTASMPIRTRLRPTMSDSRGRKSENSAAQVKKTVWDSPMVASSVCSCLAIVTNAGLSMLAFSWKAMQAAMSAAVGAPRRTGAGPGLVVLIGWLPLVRPRRRGRGPGRAHRCARGR